MTHDLLFQAADASQAASTAMAVFFSVLAGIALFFSQMASSMELTSDEERFAKTEIQRYESVRKSVSDRAMLETDLRRLNRFGKDLDRLGNDLKTTREALEGLRNASENERAFAREDLRGSLNALQISGEKAIDGVMKADAKATLRAGADAILPIGLMPSMSSALGSDPNP